MPVQRREEFERDVAQGRLAPVYLFVGADTVLVDRAVAAIESLVPEGDRAFAVERVHAGEAGGTPLDIASAASVFPMLGERRIVTVLRAERLLKPKRASTALDDDDEPSESAQPGQASDAAPLEAYLAKPLSSTVLVFVAVEIDRGRRLTKRLLDVARTVEFAGLDDEGADGRSAYRVATAILEEELQASGRRIEPDAVRVMVARSGGDATKLRQDVARVVLFVGDRLTIEKEDIDAVVSDRNAVGDEWAVVNALADRDARRALVEVGKRFDRGDSPHALVGQLRWWVSTRLATQEPARVRPALQALVRTDLSLKSSSGDDRVLVERLVVELSR